MVQFSGARSRRLARDEESDEVRVALWGAVVSLLPGDEEAVDILISVARSRQNVSGTLRAIAIRILGDTRLSRILPILVEALDDEYPEATAFAAIALGQYGSRARTEIPRLIEFFHRTPAEGDGLPLRALTIEVLAAIDPASPAVLEFLKATADSNRNEELRDHAEKALARIDGH